MFDIQKYLDELENRRRVLHWLINGQFIHCIPVKWSHNITPEWIVKNYNVEWDYFDLTKTIKNGRLI